MPTVSGMSETPPTDQDPRVDYSRGRRPGVRGGECSACLHRPPLHERGCTALPCVAPGPCGCAGCVLPWTDLHRNEALAAFLEVVAAETRRSDDVTLWEPGALRFDTQREFFLRLRVFGLPGSEIGALLRRVRARVELRKGDPHEAELARLQEARAHLPELLRRGFGLSQQAIHEVEAAIDRARVDDARARAQLAKEHDQP